MLAEYKIRWINVVFLQDKHNINSVPAKNRITDFEVHQLPLSSLYLIYMINDFEAHQLPLSSLNLLYMINDFEAHQLPLSSLNLLWCASKQFIM
jgi:hypothetical protein